MNSCNQKLCRNHVQPNISLGLLQLLIRCSLFVCLFVCCVPPNSVVQINNFRLILFSAEIRKRRGKKLVSKTIKYKLGSSSKMPFAIFPRKTFIYLFIYLFIIYLFIYLFIYLKTIDFVENLEWRIWQGAAGAGGHFFASLWRSANKNRYVIHP